MPKYLGWESAAGTLLRKFCLTSLLSLRGYRTMKNLTFPSFKVINLLKLWLIILSWFHFFFILLFLVSCIVFRWLCPILANSLLPGCTPCRWSPSLQPRSPKRKDGNLASINTRSTVFMWVILFAPQAIC